jgi:hypothetical protein
MEMFGILGAHLCGAMLLRDDARIGIKTSVCRTAPRMPKNRPVENRDFLGKVGALWTALFAIVGADRRHSGGT